MRNMKFKFLVTGHKTLQPLIGGQKNSYRGKRPPHQTQKNFYMALGPQIELFETFCGLFPHPERPVTSASAKIGHMAGKTGPHGVIEAQIEHYRRASFEPPPAYNDGVGPGGLPARGLDV